MDRRLLTVPVGERLSVLYVVSEDWYFWSHRVDLARAARDAGCEVAVATVDSGLRSAIEDEGFSFYPLRLQRRSMNPQHELLAFWDIVRVLRSVRPDIAHLVALKPMLYGGAAARICRTPAVVCAVAGLGSVFLPGDRKRTLQRKFVEAGYQRFIRGRANVRVIVQNPDDQDFLVDRGLIAADQARLVRGCGVDTARFAPGVEPAGPIVVLAHSRMLWDKGIGELVKAAHMLADRGVDTEIVLAGDPDPSNPSSIPLRQLEEWNREGVVKWLRRSDDVPSLLGRAHIACLPSYMEGTPQSLVEAIAVGLPVVTTDVPGCREVVEHESNGLLVPPRSVEPLADALERLVADQALRAAMGEAGRERAERLFSRDTIIADKLAVYAELVPTAWAG